MNLSQVIIVQIKKINQENQDKAEASKKAASEQAKKETKKEKIRLQEDEVEFVKRKKRIESSNLRQIMETIVQGLEDSSNQTFSLLKKRILEMLKDNQHYEIGDNSPVSFRISEPYDFDGYYRYEILLICFDQQKGKDIIICSFSCPIDAKHFNFSMNLYQHEKNIDFTSGKKKSIAKKIIKYLMAE
jgi:hypothetical protein